MRLLAKWWRRRPRVFLSYAREDAKVASAIFESLTTFGCKVFMDTQGTEVGERFETVILTNLQDCDAFVPLYSPAFIASDWCRAEMHAARALRLEVYPCCLGEAFDLPWPAPLVAFVRERQCIESGQDRAALAAALERRFRVLRRRKLSQWLAATLLFAVMVVSLAFGLNATSGRILIEWKVGAVVRGVVSTRLVFSKQQIDELAASIPHDQATWSKLAAVQSDPQLTDSARLNAKMLAAAIHPEGTRWYLRDIDCSRGEIKDTTFADVTFLSQGFRDTAFRKVSFANVYWGDGFGLTGSMLQQCTFTGGEFGKETKVIGTKFVSCLFEGITLDVTGFGASEIRSGEPANENIITNGVVSAFNNSVIVSHVDPPKPGVMDLDGPENEVRFVGVVFTNCRFEGFIRPTWFEKCSFTDCFFPKSLQLDLLREKNTVAHPISSVED